jgi:UDP-N-acetylmuramoyl-L-alanyl-D-glutamate--2,6-diaminopimelate ligase
MPSSHVPVSSPANGEFASGISLRELAELLTKTPTHEPAPAARVIGDADTRVTDVRQDSRAIRVGDLFVARVGETSDGRRFVRDAVARGAAAVMTEARYPLAGEPHGETEDVDDAGDPGAATTCSDSTRVPVLEVANMGLALGAIAEAVHGFPSRALQGVAITGTNGKTTTAVLLQEVLTGLGVRTARIGTLGYSFEDDVVSGQLTTPAADELTRLLARARDAGATHFVMEASSHALAQRRLDALHLTVAAFTNLTQDHLDYHGTLDAYGEAKARLFFDLAPDHLVFNVDDAFGRTLAGRVAERVRNHGDGDGAGASILRVGHADAEVQVLAQHLDASGIAATVSYQGTEYFLRSELWGEHNLANLLLCAGIGLSLGFDARALFAALGDAVNVPGRLERCDDPSAGDDIHVFVDYAHTPDALERALAAVSPMRQDSSARLICVFGCGGDRDADKRPLMGGVVGRLSDWGVLTNDNPRSEDPSAIARDVEVGLRGASATYDVELDRAAAIRWAILDARPGDLVLIAGKGHETYQIVGDQTLTFDDRVQARGSLQERRAS